MRVFTVFVAVVDGLFAAKPIFKWRAREPAIVDTVNRLSTCRLLGGVAFFVGGCGAHHVDTVAIGATPSAACAAAGRKSGPSPIRRLTHFEYDDTLRELLGDGSRPSAAFPPDEKLSLFSNDANAQTVTRLLAEGYMNAAEGAAAHALGANPLPCGIETADDACIDSFIGAFGMRAFRRPLDDGDRADLRAAFDAGRAENGTSAGVASVIEVVLQSPEYLYRAELGPPGAVAISGSVVPVTPWELASRLSYLFWGTMPDAALFDAAQTGALSTADGVRTQAERLLADPKTRVTLANFYGEFLELDQLDDLEKDPSIYPSFEPAIRTAFRGETLTFIDSVLWDGDALLSTLLTAPYTFVNGKLAAFYGMAPVDGTTFRRVEVDTSQRGGLLTQGSFLATRAKFDQTSPVYRGKFVRERLFCTTPSPPPPNLAIRAPDLDPRLTTRERFAQHSVDPFCAGCHHLMDPIGLGFENFDGAGAWRDTESGQLVDGSGELTETDIDGAFDGVRDLEARLAKSGDVERCTTNQWFRFAHGRADTPDDACSLDQLGRDFHASGGDLRKLLVAITQTDAFRYRTVELSP
jgi:hypothetical protein